MTGATIQDVLGIGKTRYWAPLKSYRHDPEAFSRAFRRAGQTGKVVGGHRARERDVLAAANGARVQYDASHHRWLPFIQHRWPLITSRCDYRRPGRGARGGIVCVQVQPEKSRAIVQHDRILCCTLECAENYGQVHKMKSVTIEVLLFRSILAALNGSQGESALRAERLGFVLEGLKFDRAR